MSSMDKERAELIAARIERLSSEQRELIEGLIDAMLASSPQRCQKNNKRC